MTGDAGDPSAFAIDAATPVDDADTVTLARGTTFLVARRDGSMAAGGTHGFYVDDTRLLSSLQLLVDGSRVRVLTTDHDDRCLRATGSVGDPTKPALLIDLEESIDDELRIAITVTNLTGARRRAVIDVRVAADFADLFEVKRGVEPRGGIVVTGALDDDLVLRYHNRAFRRGLTLHADAPDEVHRDGLRIGVELDPHAARRVVVTGRPLRGASRQRADGPRSAWVDDDPPARTPAIPPTIARRAWADLGSLLMRDTLAPHPTIVAAGSPWFMALFGRDSLITSLETLPYRTDLAVGVLTALAARQGTGVDPTTLEEPGRIPHEARRGEAVQRPGGWGATFYGSVDATPLFVITTAEAHRRGADDGVIKTLLPAAERAVEWIEQWGDPDGDGFVEYPGVVRGASGLANQGWKDSDDAIRLPDGSLAAGPIAVVEVQGYCHAALLALADLREAFGTGDAAALRVRAERLRAAIHDHFWLDDLDCFALALDGDKRPVRTVSSNAGHLLFTGTAYPDIAARLTARLMRDDMWTGFGVRTLTATNPGFNPLSYHCGAVWPHDTALVAAGMLRAGRHEGVELARGLLAATDASGRLPELFGGFARGQRPRPVPYPTSCSPQAWAAGAPLLLADELMRAGASL